jgi:hypothetical protein
MQRHNYELEVKLTDLRLVGIRNRFRHFVKSVASNTTTGTLGKVDDLGSNIPGKLAD